MARKTRTDEDYEIEALSKGLQILESLEGVSFEPVSLKKIIERTGLSRDVVDRTLKTLRLRGYAVQNSSGEWTIGKRLIRFALAISKHDE